MTRPRKPGLIASCLFAAAMSTLPAAHAQASRELETDVPGAAKSANTYLLGCEDNG